MKQNKLKIKKVANGWIVRTWKIDKNSELMKVPLYFFPHPRVVQEKHVFTDAKALSKFVADWGKDTVMEDDDS